MHGRIKVGRWLHQTHRALGTVFCLLLLTWFLSGAVMVFAGYPRLDETDRVRFRDALGVPPGELHFPPNDASCESPPPELARLGERFVFLLTCRGKRLAFDAEHGAMAPAWSVAEAAARVAGLFGAEVASKESLERSDQWTLSPSLAPYFPLHRVSLDDREKTVAYVCAATGEIVQQTTRKTRVLAWLGAIPHWIYPAVLRRHASEWRLLVLILSFGGLLVSLSGLANGIRVLRLHERLPRSPYKKAGVRAHHRSGLCFGVLASTWLLSGALSLHPLNLFPAPTPPDPMRQAARGIAGPFSRFEVTPSEALAACTSYVDVGGLSLLRVMGRPFYLCRHREREDTLLVPAGGPGKGEVQRMLDEALMREIAATIVPTARIRQLEWRNEADDYHYSSRHERPIRTPFVRVIYDDEDPTFAYLDPYTGAVLKVHGGRSRWGRFLYEGLHRLDFAPLRARPRLWQGTLLLAMIGGAFLCASGIALLLRRMGRRRRSTRGRASDGRELVALRRSSPG